MQVSYHLLNQVEDFYRWVLFSKGSEQEEKVTYQAGAYIVPMMLDQILVPASCTRCPWALQAEHICQKT